MKLNSNGDFVWVKRNHGSSECEGKSIALDPNNNILITGIFEGTPDFDTGAGVFELSSLGYFDVFVQKLDNNGDFIWATQIGGPQNIGSFRVKSDPNGNVYTVGEFRDLVDFDPGNGTYNLSSGGGYDDGYVQKLDPNGNFQWVHQIGDQGRGCVKAITIDNNGNLFIAGTFYETTDFDPGAGVYNLTFVGPWYNMFIQKLNLNGEHVWVKTLTEGQPIDIMTDADGNIYTAGTFEVDLDFDPGSGVSNVQMNGDENMFIQKLDPNGDFLWVKSVGGSSGSRSYIRDMDLDATGNIYTTGIFKETVDFDPNAGVANLTSNGAYDIFVHKLSQGPSTASLCESDEDELIHAYPNPSSDGMVNVEFDQVLENATITVTTLDGSIVNRNHFISVKNTTVTMGESKGIYLLTVESNSMKQTSILQKL